MFAAEKCGIAFQLTNILRDVREDTEKNRVYLPAEDLARFASWQFRLLDRGGTEVLKAGTLREMHRVHLVDPDFETMWGLGFEVDRLEKTTFVGHVHDPALYHIAVTGKVMRFRSCGLAVVFQKQTE